MSSRRKEYSCCSYYKHPPPDFLGHKLLKPVIPLRYYLQILQMLLYYDMVFFVRQKSIRNPLEL